MSFWNESDLEVMELRDKMISLKQEFDNTHEHGINDYSQKFNRFLERKLKAESDLIFRKQVLVSTFSMEILKRKGRVS